MNNEIHQKVVEELVKYLPEGWEKVDMYAEVSEEESCVFFFVYVNNRYFYVYDLPKIFGISEELTDYISVNFHSILLPDQQEKKWFSMSFY